MIDPRALLQQALEFVTSKQWGTTPYMDARVYEDAARLRDTLRAALEQQEHKPELRELLIATAAMAVAAERRGAYQGASWVADAMLEQPVQAEPVALEKLLHQVIYGDFNADNTDDLKLALASRKEFAALQPRRLTDDQIGQIWFAAKIPGLTESDARRLIRAAEEAR